MPEESSFNDEASEAGSSMPPPRRQHKYSTKDQKPDKPWRRWCWMALCCLICLVIMILLTLWLQKLFDPDEEEDWSDDDAVNGTAGELTGAALLLPQTMTYIEDVCSEQKLGQDNRGPCEQACGPAKDCCDPFANGGNSTCLETEGAGCYSYAKCHSLDGFVDPAHNFLDRVCSKASLEIDRQECIDACFAVECCFTPTESCVASNFQACLDYAACQNLKENSIDVAPTDLDERCGDDKPDCDRTCREALACNDPQSAAYRDNFLTCLSYSACTGHSDTKITVAPIYSVVEPAPDDIENLCERSYMRRSGPDECLNACAVAQCCWATGDDACFGNDPLGCLEYERCSMLLTADYAGLTFPPAPAAAAQPEEEPVAEEPAAEETVAPEDETPAAAAGASNETAAGTETRRQMRTV